MDELNPNEAAAESQEERDNEARYINTVDLSEIPDRVPTAEEEIDAITKGRDGKED